MLHFHVRLDLKLCPLYLFYVLLVPFSCSVLEIPTNLPPLLVGFFSLHVTYLREKHNFVFVFLPLFHAVDRCDPSVFCRTRLEV
jgi:hypothetical protein